ncbi:MAG TPA: hypothetical protein ENK91_00835 [Bacteroidetes bacterium]|nr:hypothetical protein [Bacteroidota bacterium]
MESIIVARLMRLINPLSAELKLELLSELSNNIKLRFNKKNIEKEKLLNDLFGAWNVANDSLVDDIYNSRNNSSRKISFDNFNKTFFKFESTLKRTHT